MSRHADSARLFFALVPGLALRRKLDAVRLGLHLPGRPVPVERMHATLVFLGSQPVERLAELCDLARTVPLPGLQLALNRAGSFERARVAWIGADRLPPALMDFRARLAQALDERSFSFDRKPWGFHITVYRDLRTPGPNMAIEPLYWRLREYALMESIPDTAGPRYRVVGRWSARTAGKRPRTA